MEWRPPPAEPRPEPQSAEEISPQLDFLYRAELNFSIWLQFADAKASAVVLLLGLGLLDLLNNGRALIHAHNDASEWGWVATVGFWAAAGFAIVTITQVARTLFPRARASKPSLFYFGAVAAYRDADAYRAAVERSRERDLIETLSIQAWNIARIAADKYAQLRGAYFAVAVFLLAWAVARITLTLT